MAGKRRNGELPGLIDSAVSRGVADSHDDDPDISVYLHAPFGLALMYSRQHG